MLDERESTGSNDEERYLDAARNGDLAAFNWLVLRYQTRVYNLCYRMLSNPEAAADATQDTFLHAYKAMSRFKGGLFRAWLLRIATNVCLDVLRSRKRHPTYSLDRGLAVENEEEAAPLQIPDLDAGVDPEGRALTAEMVETIQAGLAMLPDDQRIALILVDVQGLSYEEAALVSAANLGTVKSRINRARAKMRDFLRDQGIMPSTGELSVRAERHNSEE